MKTIGGENADLAVSVVEFKRAIGMFDEDDEQDLTFAAYLSAAQEFVETAARRFLTPRKVAFTVDCGRWSKWWFPVAPVDQIDGVSVIDQGVGKSVSDELFYLECGSDEPRACWRGPECAFIEGLYEVEATVGYPIGKCPRPLMQAIILIAKEWLDAGQAIEGVEPVVLNFGARTLIRQNRYSRPCEFAR